MTSGIEKIAAESSKGIVSSFPFERRSKITEEVSETAAKSDKDTSPVDAYDRQRRLSSLMAQGLREGKEKVFFDSPPRKATVRLCWPYFKDISFWGRGADSWLHKLINHRGVLDGYVRKLIARGTYP